jgi:hypothetical protein
MVVSDHGPLTLAKARGLAAFYRGEGVRGPRRREWQAICHTRVVVLLDAVAAAEDWRRAAGWTDPDTADRVTEVRNPER